VLWLCNPLRISPHTAFTLTPVLLPRIANTHHPHPPTPPHPEMLARVPEASLSALQGLLNGPRSPLYSADFQEAWQRQARASVDARKGRKSAARAARPRTAKGGSQQPGGWSFGGLFGGSKSGAAGHADDGGVPMAAAASSIYEAIAVPLDPAGHYAALGLSAMLRKGVAPSEGDVRSAYRSAAMRLHPDRQGGKSARAQQQVGLLVVVCCVRGGANGGINHSGPGREAGLLATTNRFCPSARLVTSIPYPPPTLRTRSPPPTLRACCARTRPSRTRRRAACTTQGAWWSPALSCERALI